MNIVFTKAFKTVQGSGVLQLLKFDFSRNFITSLTNKVILKPLTCIAFTMLGQKRPWTMLHTKSTYSYIFSSAALRCAVTSNYTISLLRFLVFLIRILNCLVQFCSYRQRHFSHNKNQHSLERLYFYNTNTNIIFLVYIINQHSKLELANWSSTSHYDLVSFLKIVIYIDICTIFQKTYLL